MFVKNIIFDKKSFEISRVCYYLFNNRLRKKIKIET